MDARDLALEAAVDQVAFAEAEREAYRLLAHEALARLAALTDTVRLLTSRCRSQERQLAQLMGLSVPR